MSWWYGRRSSPNPIHRLAYYDYYYSIKYNGSRAANNDLFKQIIINLPTLLLSRLDSGTTVLSFASGRSRKGTSRHPMRLLAYAMMGQHHYYQSTTKQLRNCRPHFFSAIPIIFIFIVLSLLHILESRDQKIKITQPNPFFPSFYWMTDIRY